MNFAFHICRRLAILHRLLCALLLLQLTAPLPAQQDTDADRQAANNPREIVRRSVEVDKRTAGLARNYTYQQREVRKHLGPQGEVKSTVVKTWDVTNLYGEPYSRLIQRDDQALSASEEKEEEKKEEKFLRKRKDESAGDRQKREAKEKKEREEARAFVREVVNAYDFRLAGAKQ